LSEKPFSLDPDCQPLIYYKAFPAPLLHFALRRLLEDIPASKDGNESTLGGDFLLDQLPPPKARRALREGKFMAVAILSGRRWDCAFAENIPIFPPTR